MCRCDSLKMKSKPLSFNFNPLSDEYNLKNNDVHKPDTWLGLNSKGI